MLISPGIHDSPHRSARGRDRSHDAPVRAKVLDAPDHGDDDGRQGEGGPVAEADEGGGQVEELRVVQRYWGGEN